MAAVTSLYALSMPLILRKSLRLMGRSNFFLAKYMEGNCSVKIGRHHFRLKEGVLHNRFVLAVTEGSTNSSDSEENIPSWLKPDSVETPPWARDDGDAGTSRPEIEIPYVAYLLASAITAIAAIGSVFEYVNQRPVFGILNSDSVFYTPVLGFFALTGIPTSAILWFKSVQVANKEAEDQDRRDGYL